MIDKQCGEFILICNCCGHEVKWFDTFDDVVEYKNNNNWTNKKIYNLKGSEWIELCPNCKGKM